MELKRSFRLVVTALFLFGAVVGVFEWHEALATYTAAAEMVQHQGGK